MRHQLVGLLGGAIETQRMIDIVRGTKRHTGIGAVDRGGRGINKVPACVVPAAFEHVEEAREIGVGIGVGIDQGMAHAGLRREMHDVRKAVDCEQPRHGLAVGNVDPFEPKGGKRLERRDPCLLQGRIVVGVEIVDTHHIMPIRQQPPGNVHADEAGRSGDENGLPQDAFLSGGTVTLPPPLIAAPRLAPR
jgi:hypothetical protein